MSRLAKIRERHSAGAEFQNTPENDLVLQFGNDIQFLLTKLAMTETILELYAELEYDSLEPEVLEKIRMPAQKALENLRK